MDASQPVAAREKAGHVTGSCVNARRLRKFTKHLAGQQRRRAPAGERARTAHTHAQLAQVTRRSSLAPPPGAPAMDDPAIVYKTSGVTWKGTLRDYTGALKLKGRSSKVAKQERGREHRDEQKERKGAACLLCVPELEPLEQTDGPCPYREALQRELVRTVWRLQDASTRSRVSFGACFLRTGAAEDAEEKRLRAKLARELPRQMPAALRYLECTDLGRRAARHLEGRCFTCGGRHLAPACTAKPQGTAAEKSSHTAIGTAAATSASAVRKKPAKRTTDKEYEKERRASKKRIAYQKKFKAENAAQLTEYQEKCQAKCQPKCQAKCSRQPCLVVGRLCH